MSASRNRLGRSRIVATIDLDPIEMGDAEALRFRLEVHEREGKLTGVVYRRETYRIPPTFPISDATKINELADVVLLVKDTSALPLISGDNVDAVIEDMCRRIEERFLPKETT